MTRRLADAWLDRAELNLDQGDVPGARRSLDAARELRPDAPRLQELDARVRSGS
ncbi:MAG TPA: tetratricopeptide repeat protein [Rhodanobacteraceae bacterium]|nr:tetratricopeptide repeat protein [Rhodanobacteraceae bacterium]